MPEEYVAGVCNIGAAEVARRRRAGDAGAVATMVLLAVLRLARAPRPLRLLVALPAAVSTAGYLQAARRFCVAFGWGGVRNLGDLGSVDRVDHDADRAADRRQAVRIAAEAGAVGLAAGVLAAVAGGRRGCCRCRRA
jgi:hypothetical protein